jgi:hypothetical protein
MEPDFSKMNVNPGSESTLGQASLQGHLPTLETDFVVAA